MAAVVRLINEMMLLAVVAPAADCRQIDQLVYAVKDMVVLERC